MLSSYPTPWALLSPTGEPSNTWADPGFRMKHFRYCKSISRKSWSSWCLNWIKYFFTKKRKFIGVIQINNSYCTCTAAYQHQHSWSVIDADITTHFFLALERQPLYKSLFWLDFYRTSNCSEMYNLVPAKFLCWLFSCFVCLGKICARYLQSCPPEPSSPNHSTCVWGSTVLTSTCFMRWSGSDAITLLKPKRLAVIPRSWQILRQNKDWARP